MELYSSYLWKHLEYKGYTDFQLYSFKGDYKFGGNIDFYVNNGVAYGADIL
jgi:hypothetical protein